MDEKDIKKTKNWKNNVNKKSFRQRMIDADNLTDEEYIQGTVNNLRLTWCMSPKLACHMLCHKQLSKIEKDQEGKDLAKAIRTKMLEKCGPATDGKCKKGHDVEIS